MRVIGTILVLLAAAVLYLMVGKGMNVQQIGSVIRSFFKPAPAAQTI